MSSLDLAGHTIPTGSDGRFWMDFRQPPQQLSAATLLSHELAAGALNNKLLVLDTPDDRVMTPTGLQTDGAVIAQGIENLVTGTVLARPSYVAAAELWALILAAGTAMLLLAKFRSHWAGLFTAAAVVAGFYISWAAYARAHILVDAATPGLALVLIFLSGVAMRLTEI